MLRSTPYLLRGEISALLAKVEADLRAFVDDHVQLLTCRISAAFDRYQHLGTGKLIEAMNAAMACAVEAMFAPWRTGEEHEVQDTFDRITSRFVERANRIIAEIRTLAADLFAVHITPIIEVESFTTESSHYYYIDDLFMLQLSRLPLLLPASLAKRYIRGQFLSSCREQLDLNSGRLRADFQQRLQKSAGAFSASFNAQVKATLDGLEDTLRRTAEEKQRSEAQLQTAQTRLAADRAAVAEVLARIDEPSAQSWVIAPPQG